MDGQTYIRTDKPQLNDWRLYEGLTDKQTNQQKRHPKSMLHKYVYSTFLCCCFLNSEIVFINRLSWKLGKKIQRKVLSFMNEAQVDAQWYCD